MNRVKRIVLRLFVVCIVLGILGVMTVFIVSNVVKNNTKDDILYIVRGEVEFNPVSRDSLQAFDADCIMVLGAGIKDSETPSDMLRDRLDVGIALYKAGLAPKLLLTGDNGQVSHNEIHVMLNYAKAAGVPEEDLFCDHAGFSTYDSMHRASSIFQAERIIVVTQEYHQYRALYIGEKLGLTVVGVGSDQRSYFGDSMREMREMLARFKDFFKVMVKSEPVLGGEAIPISGSGLISHGE
ncbi:MAG: DUF218 domain-containing protein [Firmicutes bacterium]|nr:DUF218 domain-containing protein [Bacillota bacterium]